MGPHIAGPPLDSLPDQTAPEPEGEFTDPDEEGVDPSEDFSEDEFSGPVTGKVGTSAVISEIDGIDKTEIGEITIDKVEAFKSAQSYGRAPSGTTCCRGTRCHPREHSPPKPGSLWRRRERRFRTTLTAQRRSVRVHCCNSVMHCAVSRSVRRRGTHGRPHAMD